MEKSSMNEDIKNNSNNAVSNKNTEKTNKNYIKENFAPHFKKQQNEKSPAAFHRKNVKAKTINPNGNVTYKIPTYKSCQRTFQNENFRPYMEDFTLSLNPFSKDITKNLFCIFDGHGGDETAKLSLQIFPDILLKCLSEYPFDISYCLTHSYELLDKEVKKLNNGDVGNTATTVLISGRYLYCANVGDSSCVLVSDKTATKISYDDKATDKKEIERVKKAGGKIIDNRVDGNLAITRSIGDFDLKNKGLTCSPHLTQKVIDSALRYCIIASDGVWDVVTTDDIFKLSQSLIDIEELCEGIINEAIKKGSEDNISCLVVELNKIVKKRKKSK